MQFKLSLYLFLLLSLSLILKLLLSLLFLLNLLLSLPLLLNLLLSLPDILGNHLEEYFHIDILSGERHQQVVCQSIDLTLNECYFLGEILI